MLYAKWPDGSYSKLFASSFVYSEIILTIKREGGHLSIQENDEPKQDLFAESENKFFSRLNDDELTFQVDNQGRSIAIILHVDNRDIPIKRID